MRRKILAITAAVALGAAMTTGAMAAHVGSGGGGFGAAGGARSMGLMTGGGVGGHTWSGTAGRTWNGPNAHAYTNNAMGPRTYSNNAMGPRTNGVWNGNHMMGHHHHHHHFAGNFPGLFLYDTGPDYYDYCAYPYYYSDPSCYYGYDY